MSINSTTAPVYTINNSQDLPWGSYSITASSTPHSLAVDGDITLTGDIFPGTTTLGVSGLWDRIKKIEEKLEILQPNPELEKDWSELRELRLAYEAKERDIKEKMKIYGILKK